MGVMRSAAFACALLLVTIPLAAAPAISFSPPAPTSANPITATVILFCGYTSATTTVNGFVVKTTFKSDGNCLSAAQPTILAAPPVAGTATFGPLPPGTYTYEAYWPNSSTLYASSTFVVANAAVPTLSGPIRALLLLALCATGFWILASRR